MWSYVVLLSSCSSYCRPVAVICGPMWFYCRPVAVICGPMSSYVVLLPSYVVLCGPMWSYVVLRMINRTRVVLLYNCPWILTSKYLVVCPTQLVLQQAQICRQHDNKEVKYLLWKRSKIHFSELKTDWIFRFTHTNSSYNSSYNFFKLFLLWPTMSEEISLRKKRR